VSELRDFAEHLLDLLVATFLKHERGNAEASEVGSSRMSSACSISLIANASIDARNSARSARRSSNRTHGSVCSRRGAHAHVHVSRSSAPPCPHPAKGDVRAPNSSSGFGPDSDIGKHHAPVMTLAPVRNRLLFPLRRLDDEKAVKLGQNCHHGVAAFG
jgi:hypothetical protein